jgi:hypothetical protein
MDIGNQDTIFEIRLTETGVSYIRRLFKLAGPIYFFVVTGHSIRAITDVIRFRKYLNYPVTSAMDFFELRMMPIVTIVFAVVNIIGVYYYVRFVKQLNYCINFRDESLFNQSFRQLLKNALFFISILVCSTILDFFYLYRILIGL